MRQIIIKAKSCRDCPFRDYIDCDKGGHYICLNKEVNSIISENVLTETFHKDCPMVGVKEGE